MRGRARAEREDLSSQLEEARARRPSSRPLRAGADRDPVTGLASLPRFRTAMEIECDRARRHGRPLSLAVLDVDGFRAVNVRSGSLREAARCGLGTGDGPAGARSRTLGRRRLSGRADREQIPVGAQIILAADAYHAMTTDRPYRTAMSHAQALDELVRGAGTQFDPAVVEALVGQIYGSRQAGAGPA